MAKAGPEMTARKRCREQRRKKLSAAVALLLSLLCLSFVPYDSIRLKQVAKFRSVWPGRNALVLYVCMSHFSVHIMCFREHRERGQNEVIAWCG